MNKSMFQHWMNSKFDAILHTNNQLHGGFVGGFFAEKRQRAKVEYFCHGLRVPRFFLYSFAYHSAPNVCVCVSYTLFFYKNLVYKNWAWFLAKNLRRN